MRKETINTFSDGMSLDLNPLGTPAKTLTNCLNGTLITYNGNELTLQNDMGNVPVGTAELPKGYVPVGMKEHGGIIYVASYNPKTGKGQLGCFPSPQQIYVSEAAQTVLEINIQQLFIEFFEDFNTHIKNIPVIQVNEFKEEIFKDLISQEARIFNTGDKFIIKVNEKLSDELRQAIDDNIITFKLYIIPTNGEKPIEISECGSNDLKLYQEIHSNWEKNIWLYQNCGNIYEDREGNVIPQVPFETLLSKYQDFLQIFPGPQGTLEFVIEFNTFELFNLYRRFTNQGGNFDVTFIGEAKEDTKGICGQINKNTLIPLHLYGNINKFNHNINEIGQLDTYSEPTELIAYTDNYSIIGNEKLFYDIMPTSKYGVLKLFNNSFLKSGELTNSSILAAHNKITNWNFEINSDHAIIQWTYTTFVGDPEIDHMRFVFIPLDETLGKSKSEIDSLYITGSSTEETSNIHKIKKLFYSGDFEDEFPIGINGLEPSYIYLCRLDVIYANGVTNGQAYKLLYTGTFFNDKDISQFNNYNRPKVEIECTLKPQQTYTIKKITYTSIIENATVEDQAPSYTIVDKDTVTANDVMFLADNDRWYKKLVGIIINVECEINSTLSIEPSKFVKYNEDITELRPLYAGQFDSDKTLDKCASGNRIPCKLESTTRYSYNGDADDVVEKKLKEYVEVEKIRNSESDPWQNINDATIYYTKQGTTYSNKCEMQIHRGIVSKLGFEDFYTVSQEGLFPVYEPEDSLYNEKLFGFRIEEDGSLSNVIHGQDFMGMAMYLAKRRDLNASSETFDEYIRDEKKYKDLKNRTAISKYDIDNQRPYSYGGTISNNSTIVNPGSAGTSLIEAIRHHGFQPIQIVASNQYDKVWDRSYWDGDVLPRITNLMCLPHSEVFEKIEENIYYSISGVRATGDESDGREKYYGLAAAETVGDYITGAKLWKEGNDNKGTFHSSHGMNNAMYIVWQTQYGYMYMNVATPLYVEQDTYNQQYLFNVKPVKNSSGIVQSLNVTKSDTKLPAANTHLRADHMLFCLLSQILIAKRKNSDLLLNAPDISQVYQSNSFKTKVKLTIEGEQTPVLVLNGKDIEELLSHIISNGTLDPNDNFVPKFISKDYTNGYIDCGGKISTATNRFGLVNLEELFWNEGLPEFCTYEDQKERYNIYPGKIQKVFGTYLCNIEKNRVGVYQKNKELIHSNGKFYKIFMPVIHSNTNKSASTPYSCKNLSTYKEMLEGFAYNDVLLPKTAIFKMQGNTLSRLNAQEDLENPFFNLLYYNSINVKFDMDISERCSKKTGATFYRPRDFSEGFAFITLFGDQSRYLDAHVFLANSVDQLPHACWDVDDGFQWSKCLGHNTYSRYGYDNYHNNLTHDDTICPSDQFRLGTQDWASAKIDSNAQESGNGDTDDNFRYETKEVTDVAMETGGDLNTEGTNTTTEEQQGTREGTNTQTSTTNVSGTTTVNTATTGTNTTYKVVTDLIVDEESGLAPEDT